MAKRSKALAAHPATNRRRVAARRRCLIQLIWLEAQVSTRKENSLSEAVELKLCTCEMNLNLALGAIECFKSHPVVAHLKEVAEAVRFELTEGSHLRRFSRPLD
jgi:hypothetical protein